MNWAAGAFAAALWVLITTIWIAVRRVEQPRATRHLVVLVGRDLVPGFLLGLLMARLL